MKLALELPGNWPSGPSINNPATAFTAKSTDLGTVVTQFAIVALYIGGFMMFFWAVWGVFDYLRAEGNKEALAKARKRIQWAIAGFIILLMAFFLSDFVKTVINPGVPNLTEVKIIP